MTIKTSRRSVLATSLGVAAASSLPASAKTKPEACPTNGLSVAAAQPVVEISSGRIKGFEQDGIRVFRGVPYGAPPVGKNRFMPPQPAEPWSGVRETLVYPLKCPYHASLVKPVGAPETPEDGFLLYRNWTPHQVGEDCLRLNVWAPSGSGKRPVMVWMHGGGYSSGSGNDLLAYDGANLARRGDAVVVTHNHRVNIFGYLDLSSYGGRWSRSVNVGLQDLVAVLQWVRDNISAFGGDPDNVTIFGQSGGGGKVLALMAMPSAKGLFHKAVVESGTFPGHNSMTSAEARNATGRILAALDIDAADLDRLADVEAADLVSVFRTVGFTGWRPVVDGTILAKTPEEADALSPGVPLLIGTNLNEAVNAVDNPEAVGFDIPALESTAAKKYGAAAPAIVAAYRKALPRRAPFELWCAMQAVPIRDDAFAVADRKYALDGKVWQYMFAWNTPMLEGRPKTFHSAEIAFVFNNAGLCVNQTGGGPAAMKLAGQISDAWLAFARHGDPNHRSLPHWPAFSPQHPTMVFDAPCAVWNDPESEGRKLLAKVKAD